MSTVIISGVVTIVTSFISSLVTWILSRKKYISDVEHSQIDNMQESLDFYRKLSDDNKSRLEEVLKRNTELEQEVEELKKQVFNLMSSICIDLTCQLRKRNLNLFNNQDGTNSR